MKDKPWTLPVLVMTKVENHKERNRSVTQAQRRGQGRSEEAYEWDNKDTVVLHARTDLLVIDRSL